MAIGDFAGLASACPGPSPRSHRESQARAGAGDPMADRYDGGGVRQSDLIDVRKFHLSADQVGKTLIFNLGGNNYRLPFCVSWELRRLFFRALLTHAEYNRVNVEALCP